MPLEPDLSEVRAVDGFRARLGDALSELSLSARTTHPDDLPATIARCAALLGAEDIRVFVADLGQRELVGLQGRDVPPLEAQSLLGSIAGRAYRTEQTVAVPAPTDDREDRTQLWVPIQDSAERLGVLVMTFDRVDAEVERGALAFASMAGEYIIAKSAYGDALDRSRRSEPLPLAAELGWTMLPPLTYYSPPLSISGLLEPAYDIAGDTFDYSLAGDVAHLAIFDAVGHDLTAARIAQLAVTSTRNTRRRGGDLIDCYVEADRTIATTVGSSSFATAILATLAIDTGELRWIAAGHLPPLVVRDAHVVQELACEPSLPLGLGGTPKRVTSATLQPGDTLVLYTDGVTEARDADGGRFGLPRLNDHIARARPRPVRPRRRSLPHHLPDDEQLADRPRRGGRRLPPLRCRRPQARDTSDVVDPGDVGR